MNLLKNVDDHECKLNVPKKNYIESGKKLIRISITVHFTLKVASVAPKLALNFYNLNKNISTIQSK